MWSPIKAQILLECIKNANYEEDFRNSPETLESSVNRLHQLFQDIRILFGVNELFPKSNLIDNCTIYDQLLYNTIKNYLDNPGVLLNYIIKPELTDGQLNTIKCVIETMVRFMNTFIVPNITFKENLLFPEHIKKNIISELSKNYDIANLRFISYYDNIFAELDDNISNEFDVNPKKAQRMKDQIIALIPGLDVNLFTQLIIFIRSSLASETSYC